MTDRSNNIFESLETIKEYRWVFPLVFLVLTISKDFIKSIIGSPTYNIIITCIISILGIYIIYQLIGYIKNNDRYNIKNMKKEFMISFIMIVATLIYSIYLLTI